MAYSEFAMENINIEESKIQIDSNWYSLNELKTTIKKKVESEDFDVISLISSLQELSTALDNITQIKMKLPVDLIDHFKDMADKSGNSFENTLRDALISRVDHGFTPSMAMMPGKPSGAQAKSDYKPKKVACKKCKGVIIVDSPERPITVTCKKCGFKGKLSK